MSLGMDLRENTTPEREMILATFREMGIVGFDKVPMFTLVKLLCEGYKLQAEQLQVTKQERSDALDRITEDIRASLVRQYENHEYISRAKLRSMTIGELADVLEEVSE